jgi:SAM-dependent methyltransferase
VDEQQGPWPAYLDVACLSDFLVGRRHGGFQIETWDDRRDLRIGDAIRSASRRGVRVLRLLLIANRAICSEPAFRRELALDGDSGIRDLVLQVDGMERRAEVRTPAAPFGLWDGEFLLAPDVPGGSAERWRLSADAEEANAARSAARQLLERAIPIWTPENPDGPDEPLFASAPVARHICADTCRRHGDAGADCAWYHGLWQYLRIFDLVSAPQRHADFYGETLRQFARDGRHRRVLISGSADYSMLAHVLHAYRAENAALEIAALDVCETPLALARWYAERAGITVATHAADILSFAAPQPFDVICTHSLLGRFPPRDRARLMAGWHRLLRPGGKVVTVNRIAPFPPDEVVHFGPAQIRSFRDRVFDQAQLWSDLIGLAPEETARWAEEYATRYYNFPVHSRQELLDLLAAGGLRVDKIVWRGSGGASPEGGGPSTKQTAEYAQLVATRPI